MILEIFRFDYEYDYGHYYSWVSLCKYAVNLSGVNLNCIGVFAVLARANDRKLHVFATKHEANTYSEHSIHYHHRYLDLHLTPTEIYDVT